MSQSWNDIQVPSLVLNKAPRLFCRKEPWASLTGSSTGLCIEEENDIFWHPTTCSPAYQDQNLYVSVLSSATVSCCQSNILPLAFQALSCRAGYAYILDRLFGNSWIYFSSSPCASLACWDKMVPQMVLSFLLSQMNGLTNTEVDAHSHPLD